MRRKQTLAQQMRSNMRYKELRKMIDDFFKLQAERHSSAPRIDLEKLSHAETKLYPITIPVTGMLFNK